MIALYIILGIIAFIVVLLSFSLTLYVSINDEDIRLKVGMCGLKFKLNVFGGDEQEESDDTSDKKIACEEKKEEAHNTTPLQDTVKSESKQNPTQPPKEVKKDKEAKTASEGLKQKLKDKTKQKPKGFSETVHMVLDIVKAVFEPSVFALKHLRFTAINIRMSVGDEDAHATAMKYAKLGIAIKTTIGFLSSLVKVKVKRVNISADFTADKTSQQIFFKVKLRGHIILFAAVGMLVNIVKRFYLNTDKKEIKQS